MKGTIAATILMASGVADCATAQDQDRTVRTTAGAVSAEVSNIENAATLYNEMMNVVTGVTSILDTTFSTYETRLEDIRRQVNNLMPVVYTTNTVYVDSPYGGGGGFLAGDDGGASAGGGHGPFGDGGGDGGCG